jgi:hypothetical protein
VDGELISISLVENPITGPASCLPHQEDPLMSSLLPPIASLEGVLQAQIREPDQDHREAFSCLADADLFISQMGTESTRPRDIQATAARTLSPCAAVGARLVQWNDSSQTYMQRKTRHRGFPGEPPNHGTCSTLKSPSVVS